MTQDESNRKVLHDLMVNVFDTSASRGNTVVDQRWVKAVLGLPEDTQKRALMEAASRFRGEIERVRRKGQRAAYAVMRNGEQLSLAILDQQFLEARVSVGREESHAAGALKQAEFDRLVLTTAEERCRERGLKPEEIEMVVGDFLTVEQVDEMWKHRAA